MGKQDIYNALSFSLPYKDNSKLSDRQLEKISGGVNFRKIGASSAAIMMFLSNVSNLSTSTYAVDSASLSNASITSDAPAPKVIKVPKLEWMIARKSDTTGKTIWYRGETSMDDDTVKYFKTKEPIEGDPFKALSQYGEELFISVTNEAEIEDIKKADKTIRSEVKQSLEILKEHYEEALKFKLKTIDEFKNLSKIEKIKYLISSDSDVTKKMICHPEYPTAFTIRATNYYKIFDERFNEYFKPLIGLSPQELQKADNKQLYDEYIKCRDGIYCMNKISKENELEDIYQITLDVLKEIFESDTI